MQALALVLLLAVSAAVEPPEDRRALAIAGLQARQTLPPEMATGNPCAVAREIARQPPCLAAGDCPSLEIWRRTFGRPGVRLLDPERSRPTLPAGFELGPRASLRSPDTRPLLMPGVICPAGVEPER